MAARIGGMDFFVARVEACGLTEVAAHQRMGDVFDTLHEAGWAWWQSLKFPAT